MSASETTDSLPTQPHPQQWLRCEQTARWIAILNHKRVQRGIMLTKWQTRVVRQGDIHEILTTPERTEHISRQINLVFYLGFAEFDAGIIAIGDGFWAEDGSFLGQVLGFDETHAPNHLNILLSSDVMLPGVQRGLRPDHRFFVRQQGPSSSDSAHMNAGSQ